MAKPLLHVRILSLAGTQFDGPAAGIALTTALGDIAVLADHAPITTIVRPGMVRVLMADGTADQTFVTFGGILDVDNGEARLLSDEVEHEDELIEKEIEAALATAQHLVSKATNTRELAEAQAMVDRQAVRLGVAQLRRRKKQ